MTRRPWRTGTWAQAAGSAPDGEAGARHPQADRAERPERGAQAGAHGPAQPGQPAVGEGPHAHPLDAARALEDGGQGPDGGVVLGVDVHPQAGPGAEQVLEQGDGLGPSHLRLRAPPTTAARR